LNVNINIWELIQIDKNYCSYEHSDKKVIEPSLFNLLSSVMPFTGILISFISSNRNPGVASLLLLSEILLDLNNSPCFLYEYQGGHRWEHIHVIYSSQNHELLSVRSLNLEQNSWLHECRSNSWHTRHLHPHQLNRVRRRVEKCEPWLILHRRDWYSHRLLETQRMRSEALLRSIISYQLSLSSFTSVLKPNLFRIDIPFLTVG
jgi:hypothetical protein